MEDDDITTPIPAVPAAARAGHPPRRWLAWSAAGMMAMLTGGTVAGFTTHPPQRATSVTVPAASQRWCPVADCSGYPDPARVRGITIATLENYVLYTRSARAQITAARAWHASVVRLQITQDKLVGPRGHGAAPRYMAAIRGLVSYALRRHLDVILNAQTEPVTGYAINENLPTAATRSFWERMNRLYGHNPHVVFDLFNEPRYCTWGQWRAAFQRLIDRLRVLGSRNELWVEGRWWGSTLEGAPLLRGPGVVYSFHHPGSPWPWQRRVGPATWNTAFGDLAARGVPMVDGEFVNYLGGYYWPRSTAMVSQYLAYLRAHRIGVVAWTLQPGIMTGPILTSAVSEPQAAGRLIWRYYHGHVPPAGRPLNERVPLRYGKGR